MCDPRDDVEQGLKPQISEHPFASFLSINFLLYDAQCSLRPWFPSCRNSRAPAAGGFRHQEAPPACSLPNDALLGLAPQGCHLQVQGA